MPRLRLTRRAVDDIPFSESGQILHRETILSGFGLRVGAKSNPQALDKQARNDSRSIQSIECRD